MQGFDPSKTAKIGKSIVASFAYGGIKKRALTTKVAASGQQSKMMNIR